MSLALNTLWNPCLRACRDVDGPPALARVYRQAAPGLHRLLDDAASIGPEYGGRLASHLPMVLASLHALGADGERLRAAHADGRRLLLTAGAVVRCTASGGEALAAADELSDLDEQVDAFARQLRNAGRDAVLRCHLPGLAPAPASIALHGLIRTAHAAETGHDGDLAMALAHWTARRLDLPVARGPADMAVDDWLAALDRLAVGDGVPRSAGRLIVDRIAVAAQSSAWVALAGRLAVVPGTFDRLALYALDRYRRSGGDFTLLHLVTGCRALRVLRPWLDAPGAWPRAVGALADTVAAACLAIGGRPPAEGSGTSTPAGPAARSAPSWRPDGHASSDDAAASPRSDWREIVARAIASGDDHAVKLVHACVDEARARPRAEPGYRAAAALITFLHPHPAPP